MIARTSPSAVLALAAALLVAVGGAHAQSVNLSIPASVQVWHYFNASNPAGRALAPPFVLPQSFPGGDRRDAMNAYIFPVSLPMGIPPTSFKVTAARIRVWDIRQAAWQTGTINEYGGEARLELYAAGFGPTYNEATWDGTQPYIGGNNTTSITRDPYPRDLFTNANIQNVVVGARPWAIGQPVGYTPGAMTEAFPVDYVLDVNIPRIQEELRQDVLGGRSSWLLSSTFVADFMGTTGATPSAVHAAGVAANPPAQVPTLLLTIAADTPSSATSWTMYE